MCEIGPSGRGEMLSLRVLDVNVGVRCAEVETRALVTAHYGRMRAPAGIADLRYTIARPNGSWVLARDGVTALPASDAGELLLLLDQDLIIELQKLRRDLYFLHAGIVELGRRAIMLVARSGGGKSTTAWALLHHGFRYLSDELGPVELPTLTVHPYPRALSLKRLPPASYPLPEGTVCTSRGFHVAPEAVSAEIGLTPVPLAAIFCLGYTPEAARPAIRPLRAAEASARLYANALNALAHPEDGLDGAIQIARTTPCFELSTGDLTATCALVKATVEGLRSR